MTWSGPWRYLVACGVLVVLGNLAILLPGPDLVGDLVGLACGLAALACLVIAFRRWRSRD